MIERFNRSAKIKAVAAFLGGVISLILTWLIFLFLPGYVAWLAGCEWPLWGKHLLALVLTGLLFVLGWRHAAGGGELQDYGDSSIYDTLQPGSMGAYITGLNRAAAGTYLLTQLALAGPLGIFRSRALLAGRIPESPDLESRLRRTLERLREANQWQALSAYPGMEAEILYLARMGMIDFSERHGEARFKAALPDAGTSSNSNSDTDGI